MGLLERTCVCVTEVGYINDEEQSAELTAFINAEKDCYTRLRRIEMALTLLLLASNVGESQAAVRRSCHRNKLVATVGCGCTELPEIQCLCSCLALKVSIVIA